MVHMQLEETQPKIMESLAGRDWGDVSNKLLSTKDSSLIEFERVVQVAEELKEILKGLEGALVMAAAAGGYTSKRNRRTTRAVHAPDRVPTKRFHVVDSSPAHSSPFHKRA